MSDLIERQAAIELIHSLYPSSPIMRRNRERWEEKYKPYIEVEKALEKLPSAHPEYNFDEWCTDCKEYDHERHCCPRFNRVIRNALKDAQPIYCQDCKNYLTPYCSCFQQSRDNWYCADGERKEDGE